LQSPVIYRNEPIPLVDDDQFIHMGMFCALEGRLQGMVFCTIVTHHLERVERILGLLPAKGRQVIPIERTLLEELHYRKLLEKEIESHGINGVKIAIVLRDTVETIRRVMVADPSW
jgi:hypothetical protein